MTECVYKVPCANCDKTYVGETGRKLGTDQGYTWHKTEVESKTKRAYIAEVSAQPVWRNIASQHSPTMRIKPITQSTGKRLRSSTESKTVLPGRSRKMYISARKVIELWIETREVISWVTPTTAFLMRQLIVASRLGKTEYQLLLMKISWWDRNVKIRYKCLVVIDELLTVECHNFSRLAAMLITSTVEVCIQQLGQVEEMVFTARRSYDSAVLGVVILPVCPSVRLTVCHTSAL